ncbi:MAG: hypothetical protein J5787_09305 [Alphaproteobacteria bacterium]|nr:hypothetical protein [Alphaproteobacteria bacterium]
MRNALYLGKSTKLLKKLAESESFISATGNGVSSTRMKDRYMILRYLAFYLYRTEKVDGLEYKSDMDDFLANVMKAINNFTDEKIEELENIFAKSMKQCLEVMGPDGFRFNKKSQGSNQRRPINMGLFEMLAYFFSLNIEDIDRQLLKNKIENLKRDMDDRGILRIIDSNVAIKYRFDAIEKLLESI